MRGTVCRSLSRPGTSLPSTTSSWWAPRGSLLDLYSLLTRHLEDLILIARTPWKQQNETNQNVVLLQTDTFSSELRVQAQFSIKIYTLTSSDLV